MVHIKTVWLKYAAFLFVIAFAVGCVQQKDFSYGLGEVNKVNIMHNTSMAAYPEDIEEIKAMISEFSGLKGDVLESGQESFEYLIDYKIARLESKKLMIEGGKYGNGGTTKYGFGCKQRPLIIESVMLKNASALKGYEAMGILSEFLSTHPDDAHVSNLTNKELIFTNATFYQLGIEAKRDSSIINNFCPESTVLELYQEEFRKKTNLSEDDIKQINYETAASIWKKIRGIE
jgi:hypothetical protein